MSTWNRHWRRTRTHKSTPAVHKNSAHQNLLHCELEYLNKDTAMNNTRQQSTLNWTHWGSNRELLAWKMLWSDWILRFPRRAGSPEPPWGGSTNQAKATRTLDFGYSLAILLDIDNEKILAILCVKTPPDSRDCSHTIATLLSELPYPYSHTHTPHFFSRAVFVVGDRFRRELRRESVRRSIPWRRDTSYLARAVVLSVTSHLALPVLTLH